MGIAIYTLTSELHDEQAVEAVTKDFLNSLNLEYSFKGNCYDDYGSHALSVIYVRTGGTEGLFRRLLPRLQALSAQPFCLLTSGKSNSLAASMEILSYLRQHAIKGEIVHGSADYISRRLRLLAALGKARSQLCGTRLGIIGEPSDWLIASHADPVVVKQRLGIELVSIPMHELLEAIGEPDIAQTRSADPQDYLPGAERIYEALKTIVSRHRLSGFTLRCFDLLTAVRNTGCLDLARLNSEGIVAGCEGDVPAMLTMTVVKALTGVSGFQANPAHIDTDNGELLMAHCTIPLNMVERYEFDTHFESGIGVGIHGIFPEGPVTVFKVSGDLKRHFIAEGELIGNQYESNLCRTQVMLQLKPEDARYFLTDPIGNHHIIVPGRCKELFEELL